MVGACYMQAFLDHGHTLAGVCDLQPTPALTEQARRNGIVLHTHIGDWLGEAELVISAVFGAVALPLARDAFARMRKGALYVDMTTADPSDMRAADDAARQAGVEFVDVAITGAVNLGMRKTPLLLAGAQAEQAKALFEPFGGRLTVVGERPGDAASLKLLRSIYTKGIEALAVECLTTATRMGLTEPLFDVLQDVDETPLRQLLESMVLTHIPHSARRRNEVVEAQHQMRQLGLQPVVSPAVEALFAATAHARAANRFDGGSVREALQWLADNVVASRDA